MTYGPPPAIEAVGIRGGWTRSRPYWKSLLEPSTIHYCTKCTSPVQVKYAHTYMKCSHLNARIVYQLIFCEQFIVLNYAPCNTQSRQTDNSSLQPTLIHQLRWTAKHTRAYWHMHPSSSGRVEHFSAVSCLPSLCPALHANVSLSRHPTNY